MNEYEQIAEAYWSKYLQIAEPLTGTVLFIRRIAAHAGKPIPYADESSTDGRGVLHWDDRFVESYALPRFSLGIALAYIKMLDSLDTMFEDKALALVREKYKQTQNVIEELRAILGLICADLQLFVEHDGTIALSRLETGDEYPWAGLSQFRERLATIMSIHGENLELVLEKVQVTQADEQNYIPEDERVLLNEAVSILMDGIDIKPGAARERLKTAEKNGTLRSYGQRKRKVFSKFELKQYVEQANRLKNDDED